MDRVTVDPERFGTLTKGRGEGWSRWKVRERQVP